MSPIEFLRDVAFEINHYRHGVSYVPEHNNVSAGLEHLSLILTYLTRSLFSQYDSLAVLFFIFAVVGIAALILESRSLALLFLSTPILYILIMSSQIVFILRNLQVLAPFFAILSARGIVFIYERFSNKYLRVGLATVVILFLVLNAFWLIHASETIRNRNPERFAQAAASYVVSHPTTRFFVSDRVWNDFNSLGKGQAQNVTIDPGDDADVALFYLMEGREYPLAWPIDQHDLTITWFGPWEVDLNYYSTWMGDDRILLMDMDTAREIGVTVVK